MAQAEMEENLDILAQELKDVGYNAYTYNEKGKHLRVPFNKPKKISLISADDGFVFVINNDVFGYHVYDKKLSYVIYVCGRFGCQIIDATNFQLYIKAVEVGFYISKNTLVIDVAVDRIKKD